MAGAVELAWLAKGMQLFRRAFDPATLFADQIQHSSGQSRGQGIEQVVGQIARFGQKQHRGIETLGWRLYAEVAAPGKARLDPRLIAGMPAPAMGGRQLAEQVIGGQAGE
ncbi:hypothetical protein D3C79_611210 [compost metagenome]